MTAQKPANQVIEMSAKKRIALSILYKLAILWRARNRLHPLNAKHVVVLEPVGLGDMIGFNPLVRELLAHDYQVTICSKPEWRPLFPDHQRQTWVNIRVPFASHNESIKYKPGLYLSDPARSDLRALHHAAPGGIGIDTRGDIRCVLMLYWAGCRRVLSLSNYLGAKLFMPPSVAEIVPFDDSIRRWQLNLRFLQALRPDLNLDSAPPPRLDHLITQTPKNRVCLMPFAPWAGKLWPRDRWTAVIAELRKRGWEIVGLCGPNQSKQAAEQIGSDVPLTECGSVEAWAREFNRCALVITLDSGPMHLADALDVPVIGLFGQGKLPLWAPSGAKAIYLHHQNDPDFFVCHPVDANTHLGQKFMNRITVQEVLAAIDKIAPQIGPQPSRV